MVGILCHVRRREGWVEGSEVSYRERVIDVYDST